MDRPSEAAKYHTRLLRCSIEVEHSRAYWQHIEDNAKEDTAENAFSEYWFGARSMSRVEVLLANFRERFDAFPPALAVLQRWTTIDAVTRRLICHWHLQLADRLYREFTGGWLVDRRASGRTEVARDLVVRWIDELEPERWVTSTRIQFARRLLHCSTECGLLKGARDPRQLETPRVGDDALTYILYLLRGIQFQGSLPDNPYLASVGIAGHEVERRLKALRAIRFRKQSDLFEFEWTHDGLLEWAEQTVLTSEHQLRGTA